MMIGARLCLVWAPLSAAIKCYTGYVGAQVQEGEWDCGNVQGLDDDIWEQPTRTEDLETTDCDMLPETYTGCLQITYTAEISYDDDDVISGKCRTFGARGYCYSPFTSDNCEYYRTMGTDFDVASDYECRVCTEDQCNPIEPAVGGSAAEADDDDDEKTTGHKFAYAIAGLVLVVGVIGLAAFCATKLRRRGGGAAEEEARATEMSVNGAGEIA